MESSAEEAQVVHSYQSTQLPAAEELELLSNLEAWYVAHLQQIGEPVSIDEDPKAPGKPRLIPKKIRRGLK